MPDMDMKFPSQLRQIFPVPKSLINIIRGWTEVVIREGSRMEPSFRGLKLSQPPIR